MSFNDPKLGEAISNDASHPYHALKVLSEQNNCPLFSQKFADTCDSQDVLAGMRKNFHIPQHEGKDSVYLCGNSLGLQPRKARDYLQEDLDAWAKYGVEGHFHPEVKRPWAEIDETVRGHSERLVGGHPGEVVVMNSLTVNLHLMMVRFYQPTKARFKIMMEGRAFPSDYYAIESQVKFHGFDPATAIIQMNPREGETYLRTSDINARIQEEGDSLALVLFSGVQYLTGQFFDIESITKAGHDAGAVVGWDCAHAGGNVVLKFHEWNVDFAVWCSYKYLNAGPGGLSGCFVNERHAVSEGPRFAGWWGHDKDTRFKMDLEFKPTPGAPGYQLSNPPVFPLSTLLASLELFDEATMGALRSKSLSLTGYLEQLLDSELSEYVTTTTPRDVEQRGCQLSLVFRRVNVKQVHERISALGVIVDFREPDTMRVAPAPLYNSYNDVFRFVSLLKQAITELTDEADATE